MYVCSFKNHKPLYIASSTSTGSILLPPGAWLVSYTYTKPWVNLPEMSTDAHIKFPSQTKILVIISGQSWRRNIFKQNS